MIRPLGAAAAGVVAYVVTLVGLLVVLIELGVMWRAGSPSGSLLTAVGAVQVVAAAAAGGFAGWVQDSTAPRWQSGGVILLVPVLAGMAALVDGAHALSPIWYRLVTIALAIGAAGAAGSATLTRFGP